MRIAHVGPRLARQGGPAGYLRQLAAAAAGDPRPAHTVTFPRSAEPVAAAPGSPASRLREALRPLRRALVGEPRFHRPSEKDIRTRHGALDAMIRASTQGVVDLARESLDEAGRTRPDVIVAHEAPAAEAAMAARGDDQQVWLMIHSPVPLALYLTWSWAVPERDWRELVALPDVRAWIGWEADLWSRVDRLIVPCADAIDGLVCSNSRLRAVFAGRTSFILTGATGGAPTMSRAEARGTFGLPAHAPVGLYLGNREPYRGLDALVDGVRALPAADEGGGGDGHAGARRGMIAVAGPARESVPSHPRIRALGSVRDVRALLEAVDFVVNVNRFSLFDLSTIEAAEAGKPLLLHAVGGNRTFRDLGCGVEMFDSLAPAAVAAALARLFAMSPERRADLGARSRACYARHLTPSAMWRRHVALYDAVAGEVAHKSVPS